MVARRVIGAVGRRSYRLARFRALQVLARADRTSTSAPVVVFQMGKVGSTTVYEAVRAAVADRLVLQVHHLTPEALEAEERAYRAAYGRLRRIDAHLAHGLYLRRLLDQPAAERAEPWAVVSLVRDPVARNVSAFFQTLPLRSPDLAGRADRGEATADELLAAFAAAGWWHDDPVTAFFGGQMAPAFGLDVLDPAQRPDATRHCYVGPDARLLVLRVEDLGEAAGAQLGAFLGAPVVWPQAAQVADTKGYGPVYREVVDRLTLDEAELDGIYDSPHVRHFYSDAEIATFRRRWSGGGAVGTTGAAGS